MLQQFTCSNFLSYASPTTIDFPSSGTTLLCGASSSGKSNWIKALFFLQQLVSKAPQEPNFLTQNHTPFYLNAHTFKQPSFFSLTLQIQQVVYTYTLRLSQDAILKETLHQKNGEQEQDLLFERAKNGRLLRNALVPANGQNIPQSIPFLSLAAQQRGSLAEKIVEKIAYGIVLCLGLPHTDSLDRQFTLQTLHHPHFETAILQLLQLTDPSIQAIHLATIDEGGQPTGLDAADSSNVPLFNYNSVLVGEHLHYAPGDEIVITSYEQVQGVRANSNSPQLTKEKKSLLGRDSGRSKRKVFLHLDTQLSSSTQALFNYAGLIVQVLRNGGLLVIDDLVRKVSVEVVLKIIALFQNPKSNPHSAQLVLTTPPHPDLQNGTLPVWEVVRDNEGVSMLLRR